MSYLNQQNVFNVASQVYNEVQKRYGLNVEGHYLEDIQKVMGKLWERNKDKQLKSNQSPKVLYNALNRKTVELVLPQVFRNIEAGYLNKTQNNLYVGEPDYGQAQGNFRPPAVTNQRDDTQDLYEQEQKRRQMDMRQPEIQPTKQEPDPNDLFERLKREREQEGSYSAPLQQQQNVYSGNNYQDKKMTYENQLPMTQKVERETMPDKDAERFVNGEPVYENGRQNMVKDVGPTNAPDFFAPRPDRFSEGTGPSLDSYFNQAANLKGEDTTKRFENEEVEDKFEKLKKQYMQDGQLDKPRDSSNKVEDVFGRRVNNRNQFEEHLQNRQQNMDEQRKMEEMANDKTTMETFRVNERENRVVEDNQRKAQQELILNNQQSNNANLNYPLIPPEKLNYQTRKYYITVDSLQRDLDIYPNPANFQVRFEQPAQEIEIPSYLNADGVVIYKAPVVYENVGGRGAKLENLYENIVEIKCLDAQVPLDRLYVGGLAPYDYNGPKIDENKNTPNAFTSYPYGPIWQENYGIRVDVLDEPYYFLIMDEIDGAYDGTNLASRRALAKLNFDKLYGLTRQFVNLKTITGEGKTFYPSTWAKLSQMTLQLVTRFNQLLDVGVDKIYIKSIERGEEVTAGDYCPLKKGQHLTKIVIEREDPSYGQKICGIGLVPGDRLMFYSIFQCNPLTRATKLSDGIYIKFDRYPVIYFYMVHDVPDKGMREKRIDVRPFLKVGDMIVINNKYILDIEDIDATGVMVKVKSRTSFDPKITVVSKGFVNKKNSGYNEIKAGNFLAPNGIRVGGKLDDPFSFQLLYPFEEVPEYLKSAPYGIYRPKEAFYIHAKKQISYTFEITQVEQNMEKLTSRVIARG